MKNQLLKICSIFVVITFAATSVDPVAFANPSMPVEVPPFPTKVLEIPAELGQVTERIAGDPSAPAFIHIQSAHGNYQAEKNIEKLLGYIEQNSSVKLMLLEGAADKLQPELFRMFPKHPDFNRKVTDKLMQEGYLTGPENYVINRYGVQSTEYGEKPVDAGSARTPYSVQAFGIEDLDAYKKDREAFIQVVKNEKTAEKFLGSLRSTIDKRFSSKLNKDLLNLVRQEEAFGSGTVSFEGWLKVLAEASKKNLTLDLSDAYHQDQYPFLLRYFRLQAIGSKVDRDKALKEKELFLKELSAQNVSKDVVELFQQSKAEGVRRTANENAETRDAVHRTPYALRAEGYSPLRLAFDRAFSKLPRDFSMKPWPAWTLYAQYVILMQELEAKGLQDESVRLEDKIQTALAQTPEEKEYLAKARELYLLRRLFSLELTRAEYEELAHGMEYGLRGTAQKPSTDTLISVRRTPYAVQELYNSALDFYKTAVVRENHMFQNALRKMGETKNQRAVIVTGGFHADGLKKLAASKGCSYIQISPRITEVSKRDHEIYLRSVLGTRSSGLDETSNQNERRETRDEPREALASNMSRLLNTSPAWTLTYVGGLGLVKSEWTGIGKEILGSISSQRVADQSALMLEYKMTDFQRTATTDQTLNTSIATLSGRSIPNRLLKNGLFSRERS